MAEGWISLHRVIWTNWTFEDRPFNYFAAWIDLLLMANHKENKFPFGKGFETVKRGSFITSDLKLMKRWGWSKSKVRRFLELLQNDSMIVVKRDSKKTGITICNYDTYQDSETNKGPIKDRQKTDKRPIKDTNNNDNNVNNENNIKAVVDSPESTAKKDFINELLEIYAQEYLSSRGTEYLLTTKGKDRDAIGSLLRVYKAKEMNKGKDSERTKEDFRYFFKSCLNIRSDPWLRDNISPAIINSQLNRFTNILKKENGSIEQLTNLQQTINDF